MMDFSNAYFRYTRLDSELKKKREDGGLSPEEEADYIQRLERTWNKLSTAEQRRLKHPVVTLEEAKKDFNSIREMEEYDDDGETVRKLWHQNYWDGPLSGVVMFKGREHWFECVLEGVVGKTIDGSLLDARAFAIVALTDEQIAELYARHRDFQENVGRHCDYSYSDEGKSSRQLGNLASKDKRDDFYARAKTLEPLDFSQNRVVAWWGRMMSDPGNSFYDMLPYEKAEEILVPKEAREAAHQRWKDKDRLFRETDPLYLTLVEGAKDPVFNSSEGIGMGVCYDGWCKDFEEDESRACKRLAFRHPHTIDLEWATKTGPIKVIVYREGSKSEEKFFWDHSAEGMKSALAYAKEALQS